MNGVRLVSAAVAAGLVGFMSLAVQAKDYTGDINDGVIAFGEITESSTITIASGTTVSNLTAITGAGALAISGGGTLVMAAESPAYSGAITIDNTIVRLAAENPLGTGKVTLNGATARLAFDCNILTGKAIVNEFEVNDSTDSAKGFYFDNPNEYITFMGPLTVNGTLQLYGTWPGVNYAYIAQFSNTVTVTDTLLFDSYSPEKKPCYYKVCGRVNAKCLYAVGHPSTYSTPTVYLYCGDNSIGELRGFYKGNFSPQAVNALGGAAITKVTATRANLNLNGKNQTCAYVSMPYNSQDLNSIYSSSAATLTLTGGVASATSSMYFGLGEKLSLVIDDRGEEGDFTQTFNGGLNSKGSTVMTIAGSIDVRRGNLAFTGSYKLANVPSISVDNGSFSLANTNETEKAFAGLTSLTIGANGSFSVNSKINPFPDEGLALDLTTGASITLTQDMPVDSLTLNGVGYPQGTHTTIFGCTLSGGSITVVNGPVCPNPVFIGVDAGQTVTDPEGLTDDATLFKLGEGKLVLTGANGYTGGTMIGGGVVEVQDSGALGSGAVEVGEGAQLIVRCSLANDIVFNGDSTKEYPALAFDPGDNLDQVFTLSGDVTINGTTHFSTGWETVGTLAGGNTANVVFSGAVSGVKLAGAPHCRVSFTKSVQLEELQGYWVDNSANVTEEVCPTRGNLGSFFVSTATCGIDLIKLDQTRFVCGVNYCNTNVAYAVGSNKYVGNPIVEFTGEHLCDGWGCYDMGGYAQGYYKKDTSVSPNIVTICAVHVRTADNVTFDSEGAQIVNTGKSAELYLGPAFNAAGKAAPSRAKIDGPGITLCAVDGVTIGARRHSVSGALGSYYGTINFEDGCVMPNITSAGGSNSGKITFYQLGDNALPSFKSAGTGSTVDHYYRPGLFPPRVLALTYTGGNSRFYVYADQKASTAGVLEVATAKINGLNGGALLPAGRYTASGSSYSLRAGTVIVFEGTSPQTPIIWTGATDGSLAAAANWSDGEGTALAEAPETYAPASLATFRKGTNDPQIDGEVNLYGLKFAGDAGMTVLEGEDADLRLWQGGLVVEAGASARTFTVEPGVWFYKGIGDGSIVVPTGDTLVLEKGLVNATNVTVSGGGTLVLGGTIPAAITVTAGTLAFAEGATLPEDDTMVLDFGENAKITVPQGQVLRVKSAKYKGEVLPVGYYSEFVTGGGMVRVDESTTPPVVETATWNAEGSEGLFSTRTNWNPPTTEVSWAGKYQTVFAAKGTGAVVDGAYDLVDMTFNATVGSFTLKKGTDDASLTVGSIGFAEDKDETVERELTIEPRVILPGQKFWTVPKNDTLTFAGGAAIASSAGSAVKDGAGTLAFHGDSTVNGEFVVSNGAIEVVGTLRGSGMLRTATLDDENRYIWLNGATLLKPFRFGDRSASAESYIRSAAPVGTTNYISSTEDTGTTSSDFERGRVFVIQNGNCYSKHYFGAVGDVADGRTRVIVPNFSQGFREKDGILSIDDGVDLLIGANENALATLNVSLARGASLTLLSNDVFTASAADRSFFGVGGDLYLGTTHQVCSQLSSSGNVHGEVGAVLEVRFGNEKAFSGNLADHVSFTMNGTDSQTLSGVSTTDGSLTVQQGTLVLGANATFKNLSTVVVSGGELTVNGADPFNREATALAVTGGTINLGAGARVVVGSATVGDVEVSRGTYTAAKPGLFGGHLSGTGSIRVGTAGMMFIVK